MVRSVHAPVEGCVSLLSLIPCLIKRVLHVCVVSVGVAGWNTSAAWFGHVGALSGGRRLARTLLGPEETPVVGVVLWSAPGLAGLTHPGCPVWVVWLWWRRGGSGCGCVLSVA